VISSKNHRATSRSAIGPFITNLQGQASYRPLPLSKLSPRSEGNIPATGASRLTTLFELYSVQFLASTGHGFRQPKNWASISGRARDFSVLHNVQTECGTHPAFYPRRTGEKGQGCDADYWHSSRGNVKNAHSYASTPPHVFMTKYFIN
jgi:hypothetical protein